MICNECGADLKNGVTFCGFCGAKTDMVQSQQTSNAPVRKSVPKQWSGYIFTELEIAQLDAGQEIWLSNCISKRTGKAFSCSVTWNGSRIIPDFDKKSNKGREDTSFIKSSPVQEPMQPLPDIAPMQSKKTKRRSNAFNESDYDYDYIILGRKHRQYARRKDGGMDRRYTDYEGTTRIGKYVFAGVFIIFYIILIAVTNSQFSRPQTHSSGILSPIATFFFIPVIVFRVWNILSRVIAGDFRGTGFFGIFWGLIYNGVIIIISGIYLLLIFTGYNTIPERVELPPNPGAVEVLEGTVWEGTYTPRSSLSVGAFNQYVTQDRLHIEITDVRADGTITAIVTASSPNISQTSTGTYNFNTFSIELLFEDWIIKPEQPEGMRRYEAYLSAMEINLMGRIDIENSTINGRSPHMGFDAFELTMVNRLP